MRSPTTDSAYTMYMSVIYYVHVVIHYVYTCRLSLCVCTVRVDLECILLQIQIIFSSSVTQYHIYIMHDKQLHVDDDHCTGSGGVIELVMFTLLEGMG